MIAQYGADGTRQAWYTQSLARIDEVLNVVNGAGKFWYQTDALGSVYALTTQAGEVRARGGYDVFGESVALSGPAVGQPFGFTGREHEADSGLVYARARYLNQSAGRWDRPDPAGMMEGPNRYAYVNGRATITGDALGLFSTHTHNFIITQALPASDAQEKQWLIESSEWADTMPGSQDDAASPRHAMSSPSQSMAQAMREWREYILDAFADGVALESAVCPENLKSISLHSMNRHELGVRQFGVGAHALMDLYSPYHKFKVWRGLLHPGEAWGHHKEEDALAYGSMPVQQAVAGLRELYTTYSYARFTGSTAVILSLTAWLDAEAAYVTSAE